MGCAQTAAVEGIIPFSIIFTVPFYSACRFTFTLHPRIGGDARIFFYRTTRPNAHLHVIFTSVGAPAASCSSSWTPKCPQVVFLCFFWSPRVAFEVHLGTKLAPSLVCLGVCEQIFSEFCSQVALRALWDRNHHQSGLPEGSLTCNLAMPVHVFARSAESAQNQPKSCLRVPFSRLWRQFGRFGRPLCALWRALGTTLGPHSGHLAILCDFRRKGTPPDGSRRRGPRPRGARGILHSGPWMMVLPWVFEHSARGVPAQPQGKSLSVTYPSWFPYRNL